MLFCSNISRKHRVHLMIAVSLYAVAVVISVIWLQRANPAAPWKYAIALLPALPALVVPFIVARAIRELDELQRRIQFEALGFGFSAAAVLSLAYGFLENAGIPSLNWVWVWPLLGICWMGGLVVARRRYR